MFINQIYKNVVFLITLFVIAASASAEYVMNMNHCLSVETSNTVGDMAYLVNSCGDDLDVTYCFGAYSCENKNGTGATDVPAHDKRTIFYDHSEYSSSLIAFACDADVDFQDCQNAKEGYFENRNPDGPRF